MFQKVGRGRIRAKILKYRGQRHAKLGEGTWPVNEIQMVQIQAQEQMENVRVIISNKFKWKLRWLFNWVT